MNCTETEALLVEAADKRLDAPAEIGFHAHIEGCAACRERAALWHGLVPGLRAIAPEPPDAMRARRMMIEIERRLAPAPAPRIARRRWLWAPAVLGVAAAAAVVLVWRRAPVQPPVAEAPFAAVTRVEGAVTSGGRPVRLAARLDAGSELLLAPEGETELALARGAVVHLWGPARVTLGGAARAVALRLDEGRLDAQVAHRLPEETFAVLTRDARVEVRGTRFSVGAEARGSWVRVDEGRVAVSFADGRSLLVGAGETTRSAPAPAPGPASAFDAPGVEPAASPRVTACSDVTRACQNDARAARESMRAGQYERALRLVAGAERETGPSAGGCGSAAAACAGELGYLRAEALRGSGRIADAIAAYKALDRRGAPEATRQNALYAAAQLEQRAGRAREARADYERALAVAPRGVLRAEALLGSMESAAAAGDAASARVLARRYLAEFPDGLGAATARRLASSGVRP